LASGEDPPVGGVVSVPEDDSVPTVEAASSGAVGIGPEGGGGGGEVEDEEEGEEEGEVGVGVGVGEGEVCDLPDFAPGFVTVFARPIAAEVYLLVLLVVVTALPRLALFRSLPASRIPKASCRPVACATEPKLTSTIAATKKLTTALIERCIGCVRSAVTSKPPKG
jgi:hypothetical protein